jgi:ketosteroid isomerase-like protein
MQQTLWPLVLSCALVGCAHAQGRRDGTPESSFRAFLAEWERAQSAFINGDPTLWKRNSSHRDDATILGAFGGYGEKGWEALGARYDWASSQYKPGGATLQVEYLSIVVSGDLALTVAIERQEGARVGEQSPRQRALRATQVFRRERGTWKLLHRHADPLLEKKAP